MAAWRMFNNCCYYLNRNNLLLGWIILNLFVFVTNYYHYMTQPGYYYLRRILGHGLSVTRSSAAIINLSCALVLLPVCRTLNSTFHRILGKFSRFFLTCWFTRLKSIHIIIAVSIVIASFVHSGGHVINAMNYSNYYYKEYTLINWATYKGESPAILILTSVVGVTGVLMLFLLTLMVLLSTSYVRQFDFDLFWGSHFLFIIFLVLFFIHPLKGVLKKQVNINDHIPGCKIKLNDTQSLLKVLNVTKMNLNENMNNKINFFEINNNNDYINKYDDDDMLNDNICQSNPLFDNMKTQSWIWVAGTLIIYLSDLALRILSRNCDNTFNIKSAKMLPGDVVNIKMVSVSPISTISSSSSHLNNINIPSQYVLVQCPRLAPLEWHPFTIVNISKDNKGHCIISLLIKIRGDWTKSICNSSLRVANHQNQLDKPLRLLIDGPFFSPMQNIVNSTVAICIAAGIGITPFAAMLHHIINEDVKTMCQPFRIHLVWVIRTIDQLKWIQKLLIKLHLKLSLQKQLQRFNLILFVTKNYEPEILQESYFIKIRSMENVQIYYGRRPNWSDLLLEWKQYYERGTVRVFLSGPPKVVDDVRNVCNKLNRNNAGCRLKCIVESFG